MKIYKTLHIGEFHTNHCEDFLITAQIGTNQTLIAVMDGCSMARESVFASILFGKILRNIARNMFYQEFVSNKHLELKYGLEEVFRQLFDQSKSIKNQLGLEITELLSTLIVGIVDAEEGNAEILAVGDGLVCVDGDLFEFDQGNKPDYLAYHLSKGFNNWYKKQRQKVALSSFNDLSICTDGIFTFKNLMNTSDRKDDEEVIQYLLVDTFGVEFDNFLDRKVIMLNKNWRHMPTDDLAIIRIIRRHIKNSI